MLSAQCCLLSLCSGKLARTPSILFVLSFLWKMLITDTWLSQLQGNLNDFPRELHIMGSSIRSFLLPLPFRNCPQSFDSPLSAHMIPALGN